MPILNVAGVAIGVGYDYGTLLVSISRNPSVRDNLIRWSFIVIIVNVIDMFVVGMSHIASFLLVFCLKLFILVYFTSV